MMNFKETLQFLPCIFKTDLRPLLLGHTGIGKTELVQQYATQNKLDLIIIYVSQLEPSDFIGLYKVNEDGRTANCPPNWLPYKLAEMVEGNVEKGKVIPIKAGEINPNGGIIFLDEVNRGAEDIRQAMYQLLTQKKVHTYKLPENYNIVCAANPNNSGNYEVYDFDDALINRFAWIKFRPDFDETQEYLKGKHGNSNRILQWVSTDKSLLQYGADFEIEGRTFSPRIEENAAILYNEIQNFDAKSQKKYLETILVPEKVMSFLSFMEEMKHINYKDVLKGEKFDKIDELLQKKRVDVLSTVTLDLADYFENLAINNVKLKKDEVKNCVDWLYKIPSELDTVFLDALKKSYDKTNSIAKEAYFCEKLKGKLKKFKTVL